MISQSVQQTDSELPTRLVVWIGLKAPFPKEIIMCQGIDAVGMNHYLT
jgi:hypothetical protein